MHCVCLVLSRPYIELYMSRRHNSGSILEGLIKNLSGGGGVNGNLVGLLQCFFSFRNKTHTWSILAECQITILDLFFTI